MAVSMIPKVVHLEKTCDACASQWEGKVDDGRFLYIRYRWGSLQVGFGTTLEEAIDSRTTIKHIGEELEGYLSFADLIEATKEILDFGKVGE